MKRAKPIIVRVTEIEAEMLVARGLAESDLNGGLRFTAKGHYEFSRILEEELSKVKAEDELERKTQ